MANSALRCVTLLAYVALAARTQAQPVASQAQRWQVEFAPECASSGPSFLRQTFALADGQELDTALRERRLRLHLVLERHEAGFRLHLRIEQDGSVDARTISAPTCSDALELAAAILVTSWSLTDPVPIRAAARAPVAAALAVPTPPSPPDSSSEVPDRPAALSRRIHVLGLVEGGMMPANSAWPSWGAALGFDLPIEGAWLVRLQATWIAPSEKNILVDGPARVAGTFAALALAVGYQLPWRIGAHDLWMLHAGVEGGALYGESQAVNRPGSGASPALAAQFGASCDWHTRNGWGVLVMVLGQALLLRPELVVDGIGSVHRPQMWNGRVHLGVFFDF